MVCLIYCFSIEHSMKGKLIISSNNGKVIAINTRYAQTVVTRMIGLLATSSFNAGDGLYISPCSSIHTVGMKYPIDVVFINEFNIINKVVMGLKPNRICLSLSGCCSVLELPQGVIKQCQLMPGDTLHHYDI